MKTIVLTALLSLSFCVAHAGVTVIAHSDVAFDSLAKKDAKAMFLGKKKKWPDGTKATIVVQKSGDIHKKFIKSVVGKSTSQFKTFWKKQVFTGKGKKPKTVKTDADVVAFVSRTAGAIGYISDASAKDGVKVITVK